MRCLRCNDRLVVIGAASVGKPLPSYQFRYGGVPEPEILIVGRNERVRRGGERAAREGTYRYGQTPLS
jgi:hypothetical protein